MQRKKFLTTTFSALPLLALSQLKLNERNTGKPFVVRAGESRTGKPMKYRGKHPNDIIISKKDTDNNLSVFFKQYYAINLYSNRMTESKISRVGNINPLQIPS